MELQEIFERCEFKPNTEQIRAIEHTDGPLLIIAGPGSGKTAVLIFRALNLVLRHNVKPENILLCTFTEKAAEQLKTRLLFYLRRCKQEEIDITKMSVDTIHSICNGIIQDNINEIPELHKNYEVLAELTQTLFMYENFDDIFGEAIEGKYLAKWGSVWHTIEQSLTYFGKITEECIDVNKMKKDSNIFLRLLADAYLRYKARLEDTNHIDFSFQQRHVLDLISSNNRIRDKLRQQYKYIMVDEYQDTNYVQEQIMLTLASPRNNICVVGDEDQALYRFRGATVRNILEFKDKFHSGTCADVKLETNYRSHKDIIRVYNDFMDSDVWYDEHNRFKFRFNKQIRPDENSPEARLKYESVVKIVDDENTPEKVAEIILYLRREKIITDLNQIAFFMRSIAYNNIRPFLEEFERCGIPYYAPRARKYFENNEVKELVACLIYIFSYTTDEVRNDDAFEELVNYCNEACKLLKTGCKNNSTYKILFQFLQDTAKKINELEEGKGCEEGVVDMFYRILSFEPFRTYLKDEACARNLANFSELAVLFEQYYKFYTIDAKNKEFAKLYFFNSYLRFLISGGINEYEDPYDLFPSGKVQVMTVHQAKGLEFPVVFVAGLEKKNPPRNNIDEILGPYYRRKEFEPYDRISAFDQMRLSYVAFSRPQHLLVLVSSGAPFKYYHGISEDVTGYECVNKEVWKKIRIKVKDQKMKKLEYSFTSHINVYDTCPRQYLMYKEHEFTPARAAQVAFGGLVHQTLEDIHRHVIERLPAELNESKVIEYLERNKKGYIKQGIHPFNEDAAKDHVLNYFRNNKEIISRAQETGFEVVVERSDYYLKGVLDLIRREDAGLDIIDFRAQTRPEEENTSLEYYRKQLAVYSYIVEKRKGMRPKRAYIYWTGEPDKSRALMEVKIDNETIDEVIRHFDTVVARICNKEFGVQRKPDKKICGDCDFSHYCKAEK